VKASSIAFANPNGRLSVAAHRDAREDDRRILEASSRYRARLANFIRSRVPDPGEAEDILQEVFYELVAAYRLFQPVEQAGAWLFRVARNRITDFFREKKPQPLSELIGSGATVVEPKKRVAITRPFRPNKVGGPGDFAHTAENPPLRLEDILPSPDAGPDAAYALAVLLDEIEAALDELPPEQRAAFVAHEIEGRSFKDLAAEAGVSVNAMVLRKHHAVLYLRRRLQAIHDEFIGE
jgi:RNA polymerase sigma factor (sigma-70 family)